MPVLVSISKHDKQYLFHHNLKSSVIPPRKVCVWGGGGGGAGRSILFSRPSVRQCLNPSVRDVLFFFEIHKIAVCFLWLSLPGHYRVTDEALLAETT